ncbi:hypothetical protein SNE40_002880 [Patella caerulea]|uniref:DDE-1 domain-containing protein n=1 Tax=Patella caerulea TaxID=87958 RepID=A0AAN8KEV2_PATCE
MEEAILSIKTGRLSYSEAFNKYGIAKSTLRDHVKGKILPGSLIGRPTVIPEKIENQIVDTALKASAMGFGVSHQHLIAKTGRIINQLKLNTPFKGGIPGIDWFNSLQKRHPEISLRKPEKLAQNRVRMMNQDVVSHYFQTLNTTLESLNIKNCPDKIWNMDETGFMMEHTPIKICARKGSKSVPARTSNSRESVTCLATVNARGHYIPPMVIVRGKTSKALQSWKVNDAPDGTFWSYQSRAWMEDALAQEWFAKVFLPSIGPERPQVLLLDSHSSHETLSLIEIAQQENITLLTYPPHTTHYLQPLDRTVFKSLKSNYNKICSQFQIENPSETITKKSWPAIFKMAFTEAMSINNIQNGFKSCGIYPFNPESVPEEAFMPSTAYRPKPSVPSDSPAPSASIPTVTSEPSSSATDETIIHMDMEVTDATEIPSGAVIIASDAHKEIEDPAVILDSLADGARGVLIINNQIQSIFIPPTVEFSTPAKPNRMITSCRVLTSREIVSSKRKEMEEKENKRLSIEKRKEERKRKTEERKDAMEKRKCAKKTNVDNKCLICGRVQARTGERGQGKAVRLEKIYGLIAISVKNGCTSGAYHHPLIRPTCTNPTNVFIAFGVECKGTIPLSLVLNTYLVILMK